MPRSAAGKALSQPAKLRPAPTGDIDLGQLNAVRLITVLIIGFGYASTMPVGPHAAEWLRFLGYDPSWYGIQILFFLSGYLAWRSLGQGRSLGGFVGRRARRTFPWVALYTAVVTLILYPALCDHSASSIMSMTDLAIYFARTVTLIDPGGPMPGALDGALYMCLLQGTIWTLRWGAIALIGLTVAYAIGLRNRLSALLIFALALAAYVGIGSWTLRTGSDVVAPLEPGLRLAYPFMLGAVVFAIQAVLPRTSKGWLLIAVLCLTMAAAQYALLPWTHIIEIFATSGFCALAMAGLYNHARWLSGWPNLVLPTYLGVWPTAQVILALLPGITIPALIIMTLCISVSLAWLLVIGKSLVRRPVHGRVQTA